MKYQQLKEHQSGECSKKILERVKQVHSIQSKRYKNEEFIFNANIPVDKIPVYCQLSSVADELLREVYRTLNLSSRSYHRLLKVARTIADMDNSEYIHEQHIAEAILFKQDA